ncbi:MAG: PQQ-dependent catabolism-associated CXXCW motif protein [Aliishimia sp.]
MFRIIIVLAALLAQTSLLLAETVPEPEGYRTENYDALVPEEALGALTVSDETAFALWRTGKVAVVDVMPDIKKPKGLPEGTIWKGRTRISILGAHWWPEVGFGVLSDDVETQFKALLAALTEDDKTAPILFLCREDCWMSWNASKRAASYGYETVFWYPSGTTGWTFWDYPTERLKRADGK